MFKFIILELMFHFDKVLMGQAIYKIVCQRLPRTSRFVEQSDKISWGQATSVN